MKAKPGDTVTIAVRRAIELREPVLVFNDIKIPIDLETDPAHALEKAGSYYWEAHDKRCVEAQRPKVYMPDHEPLRTYHVGDVFMIQHGPHTTNLFAWKVIATNPITTQLIDHSDMHEYVEEIAAFVNRVHLAKGALK